MTQNLLAHAGLAWPVPWLQTLLCALAGLAALLAWTPIADRIATPLFPKPPALGAFRGLQQSTLKLVIGIIVAWVLGGFLEELLLRGVILQAVEAFFGQWVMPGWAATFGIVAAAAVATVLHLYQGPRAAFIITQLSVLFGVQFVASGYNLWAVILAHGLYDTFAFIRFAMGKSRYSREQG